MSRLFFVMIALMLGISQASAQQSSSSKLFPPDGPDGAAACEGLLYWRDGHNLRCVGDEIPVCQFGQTIKLGTNGRLSCSGNPSGNPTTSPGDVSCPRGQVLKGLRNGQAECVRNAKGGNGGGLADLSYTVAESNRCAAGEIAISFSAHCSKHTNTGVDRFAPDMVQPIIDRDNRLVGWNATCGSNGQPKLVVVCAK